MKIVQQGILLRKLNYSESSLILSFFTLEEGLQSYIFQGGKKKKGNILQVLTLVEIEAYFRPDSELGKITAISPTYLLQSIPFHPIKSGIAFFIAEVVGMCFKSTNVDARMYFFLKERIEFLDKTDETTNFPLLFLIDLTKQLGFEPNIIGKNPRYLDVVDGELVDHQPTGHIFIYDNTIPLLTELLSPTDELKKIRMSKLDRQQLLQNLLVYYQHHVEGFKTPKSLAVLQAVFS